ncbi:MAG: endopeptidase La [Deltaproteobacteria bacterium]|nr:MAG: endopeptidase La [Deltaproteobacteria bacterium]
MSDQPPLDIDPEMIPENLPILPLFDTALFPKMVLPLVVMHGNSVQLVDEAMSQGRIIGLLVSRKKEMETNYHPEDLHAVGTVAMILKMAKGDDDRTQLMVQGVSRFKVSRFVEGKAYLQANVELMQDRVTRVKEIEAMKGNLLSLYENIVSMSPGLPAEISIMAKSITEAGTLADMIVSTINSSIRQKQEVLETLDVRKRLMKVTKMVNQQVEILEIGTKIQTQVKEDMDQKQREYYLRQQLKAIREELGETDAPSADIEEFREKIEEKDLPEAAYKEAQRELKRLARMHPSSSEYSVATTYLDWITALPWHEASEDNLDIKKAKKVLDEDHFGLDKIKKRIIEYLAVRKLKPDSKGPILCLAGPPGTGKTSLGRSVARALNRKFVRIALGGVRDESEIRGHRRTYVGALPGQIIQGIRRAETRNPVFMLDEIDKLGSSFQGDPSSALLEVLDPEQNFSFSDHYLDVPFDLTTVMFVTTANVIHTIPSALLDRMEVLELSGYTEDEKIKICNRYLIPRQRKAHGLKASRIAFTTGALKQIISGYTREAGLRNLEREIATICRAVATQIVENDAEASDEGVTITVATVPHYLGPVRYSPEVSTKRLIPGVVMGLAWTPAGGDLLYVEATAMKGKGGLTLTGQLGDVMKESVTTALSFIRTHANTLKVPADYFDNHDVHVHVPAGAIPKDGPSAGVTMLTALVSLFTGTPVIQNLAMTGEITLRGEVLPIGGIKEKILAAHRAGIKVVILPEKNEKDMADIPKKVQKKMIFHFVDRMLDVLKISLVPWVDEAGRRGKPGQRSTAENKTAVSKPTGSETVL